jgi:hypothetical protein
VISSGDFQTIYVIVQDQNLRPVPDAQVELTITYPDGQIRDFKINDTNKSGVSMFEFSVNSNSNGTAQVFVTASYNAIDGETRTSFHLWW